MDVRRYTVYAEWEDELQRIRENDPYKTGLDVEGYESDIQNMSDDGLEELGKNISNNTHLTRVDLSQGVLNDHNTACLFRGLTKSSSIKEMGLYENQLSVSGVRSMVPFLQNANNLTELDLDDNNNFQSEGFNSLFRSLHNSPIETLQCENCRIESIEIDCTQIPRHLRYLSLLGNRINADGCRGLAKLLQGGDAKLESLNLNRNEINDDGVKILAEALKKNKSLESLHLSNNIIKDDGAAALAAALQSNSMLKALDLDSNRIGDDGVATLAGALQSNATLIYLDLGNNEIGDDGVTALAAALQSNATLKELDLRGNTGISQRGKISLLKLVIDISSIEATLQSNHTLTKIYVTGKRPYETEIGHDEEGNDIIQQLINEAIDINSGGWVSIELAGREKVRKIQIHGTKRAQLADLQGVTHSVYSEIDSLYMPEVLALMNRSYYRRRELFPALKSTMTGLLSRVDMKLCIQEQMARHEARIEQEVADYELGVTFHRNKMAYHETRIKAMTSKHESVIDEHEDKIEKLNARLAAMEESDQEKNQETRTQSNKRRRVDGETVG